MVSLKRKQSGFTIVELLIVIIVIGILAALVLVTFSGVQQKARNTERVTDIKATASHLETYNAEKGYYPTEANLNDATFISGELKGLDPAATCDPQATGTNNNVGTPPCHFNNGTGALTASGQYGYSASPAGCDDTTTGTGLCTAFVLQYFTEGSGAANVKVNSLSN